MQYNKINSACLQFLYNEHTKIIHMSRNLYGLLKKKIVKIDGKSSYRRTMIQITSQDDLTQHTVYRVSIGKCKDRFFYFCAGHHDFYTALLVQQRCKYVYTSK